jgi:hypothetical protein
MKIIAFIFSLIVLNTFGKDRNENINLEVSISNPEFNGYLYLFKDDAVKHSFTRPRNEKYEEKVTYDEEIDFIIFQVSNRYKRLSQQIRKKNWELNDGVNLVLAFDTENCSQASCETYLFSEGSFEDECFAWN